jgi:hypothetical protein
LSSHDGHDAPLAVDVDQLLRDVDTGRGARDTVVIPVPTQSTRAVPEVRSTVRDVVDRALRPADPAELQLICSELVSNAILHGEPPVRLVLHEGRDEVVVAVFDGSPGQPVVTDAVAAGLRIVDELTKGRWGATPQRNGKWVWAALPRKDEGSTGD